MKPEKYYLIERNGHMVGVPESLMTDEEKAKKYNELRQQAKDHFEHAAELEGLADHYREVERLTKPSNE